MILDRIGAEARRGQSGMTRPWRWFAATVVLGMIIAAPVGVSVLGPQRDQSPWRGGADAPQTVPPAGLALHPGDLLIPAPDPDFSGFPALVDDAGPWNPSSPSHGGPPGLASRPTPVPAASRNIDWVRQFGSASCDEATAIAFDTSAYYVAGRTCGALEGQSYAGGTDAFVEKHTPDGVGTWTREFGTASNDTITAVAANVTGVYVAGWTAGILLGQTGAGGQDAFVRRYDLDGNEIWTRQFGTARNDSALAVAADPWGVFMAGTMGDDFMNQGYDFVRRYDLAGTAAWSRTGNGFGASGIASNPSGVYVAGVTNGALPGDTDAFLRKYDSGGSELWARQFGTISRDYATGVAIDASSIYVTGYTDGAFPGQTNAGGGDAFLRKEDPNGNEIWTRQFGTASNETSLGVAIDATGVYVVGFTEGTFPGQTSAGGRDGFVEKFDVTGAALWTQQFGEPVAAVGYYADDYAAGAAVDAAGVLVTGWDVDTTPGRRDSDAYTFQYDPNGTFVGGVYFGLGTAEATAVAADGSGAYMTGMIIGTIPGQTGIGGADDFIRKYDAGGTEQWTRQFGTTWDDWASDLAVSTTGIFLAGSTEGTFTGQTSAGSWDAFVSKCDLAGNEVWTRQFGTSGLDLAGSIAVDSSGVYVVGFMNAADPSGVDFVRKYDFNGTEIWTDTHVYYNDAEVATDASGVYVTGYDRNVLTGRDGFVRRLDHNGTELWSRQLSTPSDDAASGVAVDASGIYVAGWTNGAFPGQTSAGYEDFFVSKLDFNGTETWTRQFGTASSETPANNPIAIDASGVYVEGVTYNGTFPGETSAGGQDAFIRHYDRDGNEIWTRQIGTDGEEWSTGVAVDASGVYLVGSTFGAFPGQTGAGGPGDTFNAFVVKIGTGVAVTIASSPSGLQARLDGTLVTTPYVLTCDAFSAHAVDAPSPQGVGATRYTFSAWSDGGGQSHAVPCDKPATYTATFVTEYETVVAAVPDSCMITVDGASFAPPATFWWADGSTHTIGMPSPQGSGGTQWVFGSWSDGGTQNHTVVATGPATYTATCETQYRVTILTVPGNLLILVNGSPVRAPYSLWCIPGSTYDLDVQSPQGGAPTRDVFQAWDDGGAQQHTIGCTQPRNYTATFSAEHLVTVATSPTNLQVIVDGAPMTAPSAYWWIEGSVHRVDIPSPQTGGGTRAVFVSWSDGGAAAHNVAVSGPATLTAALRLEYAVMLDTYPSGLAVSLNGTTYTAPHALWLPEGSVWTVDVASPQVGVPGVRYVWTSSARWSDGGARSHAIMVTGPMTLTATLETQYLLTLESAHGTTWCDGLPAVGGCWYPEGSAAEFRIEPMVAGGTDVRYLFRRWSGDISSQDPDTVIPGMDGPKVETVEWRTQYYLNVISQPGGATGEGWYDAGTEAAFALNSTEVTAVDGVRYRFAGWTGDFVGEASNGNLLMDAPKTVVAHWTQSPFWETAWGVVIALVVAAILLLAVLHWRRRRKREPEMEPPVVEGNARRHDVPRSSIPEEELDLPSGRQPEQPR